MTWGPDIVIYHGPCDDGFGAAWAAHRRWGDAPEYVPAHYGSRPPEVLGKHVLIVDFSYPSDTIERIAEGAASVVILDHHKTAEADLERWRRYADKPERFTLESIAGMIEDLRRGGYPPVCALFDQARSGARLTWNFCHPGEDAPWLIRLIEDRDLWRFDLSQTEAFSSYLRLLPYDFDTWSDVASDLESETSHALLMKEARGIRRFFEQQVKAIAATFEWGSIDGHQVPIVNCPSQFASEVGHALLDMVPCPFAATWSVRHGAIGYSLRSRDDRADVSVIAKRFGGGGHRNAAGFEVPKP